MRNPQQAARAARVEVICAVIENLTQVGRDHSLDQGRVVVCSTSDAYGDQTGSVDEDSPPPRHRFTPQARLQRQAALQGYVREHKLDAVALRLSWIYGPGRRTPTLLEDMIRAAMSGRDISVDAAPDVSPTPYTSRMRWMG